MAITNRNIQVSQPGQLKNVGTYQHTEVRSLLPTSVSLTKSQEKEKRWTELLLFFDRLDYLTTSQVEALGLTGGRRNTRRILGDMEDAKLLTSFTLDEKVYYLAAAGRKLVGSDKVRKKTLHVPHFLLRNDVYLRYRPPIWRPEHTFKWLDESVTCDAFFTLNGAHYFLEVDRTQAMRENAAKVALYRSLRDSGLYQKRHNTFPTLMFVTTSEYRQKALRALLDGMKAEILTVNDVK